MFRLYHIDGEVVEWYTVSMRNYELTLIVSPEISEGAVNDIIGKVTTQIQEEGGIISKEEVLGRRKLPSFIQKHPSGYLTLVSFSMQPEQLTGVEKTIKEEKQILRHMLLSKPLKVREIPTITTKTPTTKTAESEEKINIEDIDKKLEEIFKDI